MFNGTIRIKLLLLSIFNGHIWIKLLLLSMFNGDIISFLVADYIIIPRPISAPRKNFQYLHKKVPTSVNAEQWVNVAHLASSKEL